jgi:ubiquitin-protein ligase
MSKATLRLKNEYYNIKRNNEYETNIILENEDEFLNWIVLLSGPEVTPYAGGIFKLIIILLRHLMLNF